MKGRSSVIFALVVLQIVLSYAAYDGLQVVNSEFGELHLDEENPLHFVDHIEHISKFYDTEADIPSHSAARVRRQAIVMMGQMRVQGLTAKQDCDGIFLQWDRLGIPFSPNRRSSNEEFKHFNIYRSTSNFNSVTGMKPYISGDQEPSLQTTETNSYKDLYPPSNVAMYYGVTMVDGEGQEEKVVEAKKVVFVGAMKKTGSQITVNTTMILRELGKVLHHSAAYNPTRDEYLVACDVDVDGDGWPDQLFALRLDPRGKIVDKTLLNFTVNIDKQAGNQGWPSVAYNHVVDEYMIILQFRAGIMRFFNNKYVIISQRVMSSRTERAAGPGLLVKARGQQSNQWIDAMNPVIMFNPATGGYVAAVVLKEQRKEIVGVFLDARGKISKSDSICSFKGNAYEPNLFLDSRRNEIYFTCTVENGGVVNADFSVQSGRHIVVLTKRNGTGAHASNTETTGTKNFVGYTRRRLAKTHGYYNEMRDRLVLFWEDMDKTGKNTINTASVFVSRRRYIREVKPYKCVSTKNVRTPVAVYFPLNNNHVLMWQEQDGPSWSIGGELLQGNLRAAPGREQKNPVVIFNRRQQATLVVWQEAGVLLARHVTMASQPLCTPLCSSQQTCRIQGVCVPNSGNGCTMNNGGCSHTCVSQRHWNVQCSCPIAMQLMKDKKTCQSVPPCHGMTPVQNPATRRDYFCGRGSGRNPCPANSYCHIGAADEFAKCCPTPLPSYSVLVATNMAVWQVFMDTKQNQATFRELQIDNPMMLVALDYDSVNKRVYWSDVSANRINRMSLDGVGGVQSVIWDDVRVVDGLTLDVQGNTLYWTDTDFNRIERADLDGSNRRVLLYGLDKPRAIALYKPTRLMFWTNWGANPRIEQARIDDGNRKTVIQGDLIWPNALVIDEATRRLFWADAKLDKIETSDLQGRGRRVLLSGPHVNHPFALVILNDRLFWSDWESAGVHSVNKDTGKDVKTVAQGLDRPAGIAVFEATPPVDSSVRCPDPGAPPNGNRHPSPEEADDYPHGAVIRYSCLPQFDLHGPVTRKCLIDQTWSGTRPQCLSLPRFHLTPRNATVNESGSTLLECTTSSLQTTITWLKDGKVLTGHNFLKVRDGLLIMRAYREDRGWYVCNATNRAGSKLERAYLRVLKPRDSECGKPTLATRGKIVGGKKVEAGSYPWQVMLWDKRNRKHFCGGSLVSERWVVTAAHCVAGGILIGDIEVRLGKLYTKKEERGREQIFSADRITIHPRYVVDANDYDSDVALIHLRSPAVYTDYVRPICLPLRKNDADKILLRPGTTGVITGWGGKGEGRRTLKRMHQVTVPIVDQNTCKRAHPSYLVTKNMFCAGHFNGTLGDACQGDSGGPLAVDNSLTASEDDHRWVLAGVISWGDGCGRIGKFGVYTRVSVFARWINDQLNEDDD